MTIRLASIWFVAMMCLASGCGRVKALRLGPLPQAIAARHRAKLAATGAARLEGSCGLRVRIPERLRGREDTILHEANLAKVYEYAAKPLFEQAFQAALPERFERTEPGVRNPYVLEITLPKSLLKPGDDSALYEAEVQVLLRDSTNQILSTLNFGGYAKSAFNGRSVPDAIWDVACKIAFECVAKLEPPPPLRDEISCDIKLCTLGGVVLATAGTTKRTSLRSIAKALVADLVRKLDDTGRNKPWVGVPMLREDNARARDRKLGVRFSRMLETELFDTKRVRLVDRTTLRKILDEYDLKAADILEKPELLKKIRIKNVDMLLAGGISSRP